MPEKISWFLVLSGTAVLTLYGTTGMASAGWAAEHNTLIAGQPDHCWNCYSEDAADVAGTANNPYCCTNSERAAPIEPGTSTWTPPVSDKSWSPPVSDKSYQSPKSGY